PFGLAVTDEDKALPPSGGHSRRAPRLGADFLEAGALLAERRGGAGSRSGSGSGGGAKPSGAGGRAGAAPAPSAGRRRKGYREINPAPARSTMLVARSGRAFLRLPTPLGLATPGAIPLKTAYPSAVAAATAMITASAIAA